MLSASAPVEAAPGEISTIAGSGAVGNPPPLFSGDGGPATSATLANPTGIVFDAVAEEIYVATGNRIRKIDGTGIITTVAGAGGPTYNGAAEGGPATAATFSPSGLAIDASGNIYIADGFNYRVYRVDAVSGNLSTVCGNGSPGNTGDGGDAASAQITPAGIAFDDAGNLYLACLTRIRRIDAITNVITTVAGGATAGYSGDGGAATSAQLNAANHVAFDPNGDLYIADSLNHRVRRVDQVTQVITTVAGDGTPGDSGDGGAGTSAQLNEPSAIIFDAAANLYVSDNENHRVRKVAKVDGIITTLAGTGTAGFSGDGGAGTLARLNQPLGIAFDAGQSLLVADFLNHRLRLVETVGGFVPVFQPDNLIGTGPGSLRGGGTVGSPGGQSVKAVVTKGRTVKLFYRIENDGNTGDRFFGAVTKGSRKAFKPLWKAEGRNVTAALQAGTFLSDSVAAGGSVTVAGKLKRQADRGTSVYRFRCSSQSDASKTDVAKAVVKIKLKR